MDLASHGSRDKISSEGKCWGLKLFLQSHTICFVLCTWEGLAWLWAAGTGKSQLKDLVSLAFSRIDGCATVFQCQQG